jgi:hypothetical protein
METQNITLSLKKDILQKARLLAVQRQTSLSGLLAQYLEQIVDEETGYDHARARQLRWLVQGFNLSSRGMKPSDRENLRPR